MGQKMRIAITGGKGGTGKSLIATSLANTLSKKRKTLLLDFDVDCPNDYLILSISPKKEKEVKTKIPKFNFSKCTKSGVCAKVCKFNAIVSIKGRYPIFIPDQCNGCMACKIACPSKAISETEKRVGTIYSGKNKGLESVFGELKPGEILSESVVEETKNFAKSKEKDFILVDTAAGTHCDVITAVKDCDLALAVTEPTPLGAHDLKLILELLKILKVKTKIVLNKSTIGDKRLIEKIARKFNVDIIGAIPYEKTILDSYSKGKPIEHSSIDKIVKYLLKK